MNLQKLSLMAQEQNPIYSLTLKLHFNTVQAHQVYGYRWSSLLSPMAFF